MKKETILLGHGSGGKLTRELLEEVILRHMDSSAIDAYEDQARLNIKGIKIAFTTDSHVVNPVFFKGGNIGDLAINGTVNDLVVGGAIPLYLSCGFIIEEGFPIADFEKILTSIKMAALKANVKVVTGDTKVVEKGKADKIFINTSGIGVIPEGRDFGYHRIQSGDRIIISGTIAEHGTDVLLSRGDLPFYSDIRSDTNALNSLIEHMIASGLEIHAMRDPTRGGVATTLKEFANSIGKNILIEEKLIPIKKNVRSALEILGLDPLYVACEGRAVIFVKDTDAEELLKIIKEHPDGRDAAIIGSVLNQEGTELILRTEIGGHRLMDMLPGDQLPRIC
ncbi:MAG: hydrogenase expression/formation protein HypE [Deltaproteobacteria bacterium]|nr:hydrogenase expression/formation protein HypE [Deltaproteobacteria bacterium]